MISSASSGGEQKGGKDGEDQEFDEAMDAYDDKAEPEKLEVRKPYDNKLLPESTLPESWDNPDPDENDPNAPRPLKITDKEIIIGVPEPPEWSWDPEI